MDFTKDEMEKILSHCVIVEIAIDFDENEPLDRMHWAYGRNGERLIAFSHEGEGHIMLIDKNNKPLTFAALDEGEYKIIQGDINKLPKFH